MDQKPHIAIVPSPGMGHLIPLVEFAKQLVLHHDFSVTFIITTTGSELLKAQKLALDNLPQSINLIFLPPVSFEDLSKDTSIQAKLTLATTRSLSLISEAIRSLVSTSRLVALVTDHFGTDAFDVAFEFNVPPYLFFTASPLQLAFLLFNLPTMDLNVSCEYRDIPTQVIDIPGFGVLVHVSDLPDPVQNRKGDAYKWFLHNTKRFVLAEGILVNSFVDFGVSLIGALQEEGTGKPPVYPIGPLIRSSSSNESSGSDCLEWLDRQPSNSVLFVSFGSGGTLSYDQLTEFALGLEMSEQKFLWVVKSPDDKSASGSYFSVQSNKNPFDFLPKGFVERTKGQGLVVPSWAPQIEILGHSSTGGFVSHCGWNSILESVVHGVPLIAWPLFAEQRLNAVILSEDQKVALRPKANENGLIGRDELAKVVKDLLTSEEGMKIRERMNSLKEAAAKALSKEGSSTKTLSDMVLKWKNHRI
ncbi:hydroquinone glucosyltransferase-like [Mangifera indica]|uniref:hydroquinone glucosyltransferase-like n=1 Tax=Mangifera indica TaxID=29780 RepID=UPI001CF9ADAE|nr:hydroquinone glucosyltransferase-like [Mangifera indica]